MLLSCFKWRPEPELFRSPVCVVVVDELTDRLARIFEGSEDPAVDGLLFERSIEALGHAVGLGLFDKAEARPDAPIPDLLLCMIRQQLAAVIQPN